MARISTYSLDEEVSGGDKWIGSDSGFYNKTKNFTPLKLADYFNSSEKIDLSNSLRFWYQTLDPLEERSIGTISFEEEVGASVPFSSVSSFLLSKKTEGTIYIYDFFNSLIESKILLHKADTINTYAIYEVVGIEEYDENSEFIKVDVLFIRGNGGLLEDKSYLISVVDFALEASLNWGNIEGTLSDQTDLQDALDLKANIEDIPTLTSELTNDSGFITSFTETDPIFQASEASLFVAGDKANLDNQSGVNSGDETTLSIQTKRPLKTVNGESLEGSGNITVGSSITNTSELINDGADGTSTYVETDELGAVAFSNDYNDLNNKPSVATLLREEFVFSGDQTFTLANNYAQLYSVEVQGQGALSTSQYTLVAPNQVTINDTLDAGDYVVIIYSDASAGVVPYYTQAQTDALLSSKLNEDFSSLPTASLPLSGSEELAITQDGETRKVAVSEFGGGEKEIQCFWPSINWGGALNTWRSWNVNTSNIYFGNPNQTLGTGVEPTRSGTWFGDTNVIKLRNVKQIKKFIMSIRKDYTIRSYETFFVVADYGNARGNEPNGQIISNTTFSTTAGSNYIEILPNVHADLNENSVLYLIFRQTAGAVYQFEGIDFKIITE